jgi:hypothetical protein
VFGKRYTNSLVTRRTWRMHVCGKSLRWLDACGAWVPEQRAKVEVREVPA